MQSGLMALVGIFVAMVWVTVWELIAMLRAASRQNDVLLLQHVFDRLGARQPLGDAAEAVRLGHAARRCITCRRDAQCRAWLEGDGTYPLDGFCPNASLISELCERTPKHII